MKRKTFGLLLMGITLSCIENTANLQVNSNPPGAVIWLDGDSTGYVTNHLFTDLYAGIHHLKLVFPHSVWEDTFTLERGETKIIEVDFPELKWKFDTDGLKPSPPAVGNDGTVYTRTSRYLYAINPDGTIKWRFDISETNFLSAPSIGNDGTIYIQTIYSIYAVNPTGTLKWKFETDGYASYALAIGSDGTLYVQSNGALRAVNSDGSLKWQFFGFGASHGYSPPALDGNGTIYIQNENYLYAINPTGTLKWKFAVKSYHLPPPLAISSDGIIYCGADYRLYAVNSNGSQKWKLDFESMISGFSIGTDGTIYVGTDYYLYAINPDGGLEWGYRKEYSYYQRYPPAVSSDGTIYVGSTGYLYAINPDGRLKWKYGEEYIHYSWSSPTLGSDSTLYVGTDECRIYAIKVSGTLANSSWPMFQHDAKHTGRTEGGK